MIAVLVNSLIGGGAERVALNLSIGFTEKGVKSVVICLEKENNYPIPEGVEVVYLTSFEKITNPILKLPWVLISAYRLMQYVRSHKVELVQSHLVRSNMVNILAKWMGGSHKAQIVSHLPLMFGDDPFFIRPFNRWFSSWYYRKADQVVAISEQMRKVETEEMGLAKYQIDHQVIHNPHDLATIQKLAKEEPDGFTFDPEKFYLISAGRLRKHKRVDDLIQALAILRETHLKVELLILGKGDQEGNLKALSKELGQEEAVHFLGYKSNPFALIAHADVFVLGSESEGLPNIIIEALASGTPVISTDCISGPREILSPETDFRIQLTENLEYAPYGVLYPVGKARLLVKAVQQVLEDEGLREEYRQAGYARIKDFDRSVICTRYLERILPEKLPTGEKAPSWEPKANAV